MLRNDEETKEIKHNKGHEAVIISPSRGGAIFQSFFTKFVGFLDLNSVSGSKYSMERNETHLVVGHCGAVGRPISGRAAGLTQRSRKALPKYR